MRFHERNVLVGRCVIDDCRLVLPKNFVQPIAVLHASDLRVKRNVRKKLSHFAVDFKQRGFRNLESDNSARLKPRYLSAQLETDRSCRSGDKDYLVMQRVPDRAFFKVHRAAPKQILHRNFPNLAGLVRALRSPRLIPAQS